MEYAKIVEEALALRQLRDTHEAKFYLGLVEIEREHMSELKKNGCATFEQFIKSYDLCHTSSYRAFTYGLQFCSPDETHELGAPAVRALRRLVDNDNVTEYKGAIRAWIVEHNGLRPTIETCGRVLRQVDPRKERPAATKRQEEIRALREENTRLQREVNRLTRVNAKLEAALAACRERAEAAE